MVTTSPMEAPNTLRILISFCLCCVVKAVRPNNPKQVMIIVSTEKLQIFYPAFDPRHIAN